MADTKQHGYRLKGAVLILILTVMFVLIVTLMATLSVVATARQRTYLKFEEKQATLTSRSAVQYFVEDILGNDTDKTANDDPYYTTATDKMTYAREIELKIRTLKSLCADEKKLDSSQLSNLNNLLSKDPTSLTDDDKIALNNITNITGVTYDPALYSYNNQDDTDALCDDSGNALSGYGAYSGDKLTFEVTLPKVNSSPDYGQLASGGKSTITVEVLERYFSKGVDPNNPTSAACVKFGNRAKDVMKLRITSKATLSDTEAVTVLILDITDPPKATPDFTKALSTTSGVNSSVKTFADGGMAALNDYTYNNNSLKGGVFIGGNLTFENSGDNYIPEGKNIVAVKDIELKNSVKIEAESDDAFIFCGGNISNVGNITIGTETNPIDIMCGTGALGPGTLHGDIYCEGDLTLNQLTVYGNIYVKGTLKLGNTYYTTDKDGNPTGLKISGQCLEYNSLKKQGYVYCNDLSPIVPVQTSDSGAIISIDGNSRIVRCGDVNSVVMQYPANPYLDPGDTHLSPQIGDATDYVLSSTGAVREIGDEESRTLTIKLPKAKAISGVGFETKEYTMPTYEAELSAYLQVQKKADGSGYEVTDIITAEKKFLLDNNIALPDNPADMTLNQFSGDAVIDKANKVITSSGILPPLTGNDGYNGYKVKSGITLQLVPGETYYLEMVAIDDDDRINIIIPESTSETYTKIGGRIFSAELNKIMTDNTYKNGKIYTGTHPDANYCLPPRIYIYAGKNSHIFEVNNQGNNSTSQNPLINAYVYAPECDLRTDGGCNGTSLDLYYNNQNPSASYGIIGGAIVREALLGTQAGFAYIDPSLDKVVAPGKKMLNFKQSLYTNDEAYVGT